MEVEFLEKKCKQLGIPVKGDEGSRLSIRCQCRLLKTPRSVVYYELSGESEENLEIMAAIDRLHMDDPSAGTRRMVGCETTDRKTGGAQPDSSPDAESWSGSHLSAQANDHPGKAIGNFSISTERFGDIVILIDGDPLSRDDVPPLQC